MQKLILGLISFLMMACQTSSKSSVSNLSPAKVILFGESHESNQKEILTYLDSIDPHSVLIEVPSDLFKAPNDPEEEIKNALTGQFIGWQFCKEKGALCSGFDMQGNDLFNIRTRLPSREEQFVKSFLAAVKRNQPKRYASLMEDFKKAECESLQEKNSESCDNHVKQKRLSLIQAVEELRKQGKLKDINDFEVLKDGELRWQRRNKAMAQNICNYSKSLNGKTIVVIVGYEHRYMLKQLLTTCPINLQDPSFTFK